MAEYIEREALEKFIESGLNNPNKDCAFGHDAIEILTELHHMPAADVAPVRHARWEINCDGYYPYCPVCRKEPENGVMSKFCPSCGARMNGKDMEA